MALPDAVKLKVMDLKVMNQSSFEQNSWSVIGSGFYGQVWKAKHCQWGFDVAIKQMGLDNGLHSDDDLKREAYFMVCAAECPYSVRVMGLFRGFIPGSGVLSVGLVMERMETSLAFLLKELKHRPPWPLVFRLAHQVALGMNYLHCLEPALIHKDLKPGNILLDSGLNVKITDFGLTKCDNDVTDPRYALAFTPFYAPPEASQGGATYAFDVYSYAMLLYSILNNGQSIPAFDKDKEKRPSLKYVQSLKANGLKPLLKLMVKCWNQKPDQRPRFKECVAVTERSYEVHKEGIRDVVYKVQQDLACTELEQLRNENAEMRVKLQLQKDKMAKMRTELARLNAYDDDLRRIQKYEVDVTLDPHTAHGKLILSDDGKELSCGDNNLPDNTERFSLWPGVLGQQGFSGRFYYEVQVGGQTDWRVGVARESIDRRRFIPGNPNKGYWTIVLLHGRYFANDFQNFDLPVRENKLQTVGVFVDYEEGLVSFYDVENRVLLYSFNDCSFTERLFPFFCLWPNDGGINSAPLIIWPL